MSYLDFPVDVHYSPEAKADSPAIRSTSTWIISGAKEGMRNVSSATLCSHSRSADKQMSEE